MFINREAVEVTATDLAAEFQEAQTQFNNTKTVLGEEAEQRQQVVRHRLATLEQEDRDLQNLQHKLNA